MTRFPWQSQSDELRDRVWAEFVQRTTHSVRGDPIEPHSTGPASAGLPRRAPSAIFVTPAGAVEIVFGGSR